MTTETKYPEYIMQAVRQNLADIEEDDASHDYEINGMSHHEIFDRVCNWEGIINYGSIIRRLVRDIYGVELK